MVQKEVAERMVTGPGSKNYGALSLAVSYYTEPEISFLVGPECFMPRPKVDSAVVHMVRRDVPPVSVRDEKLLFDLIRASFNERRKTLQNGIANYAGFSFSKEEALRAIEACGFKPTVRGEALTLSEFGRLADELCLIRGQRNRQD
jgi:16S rRNA (adenine1518-N6/adenine1519-N6)-dimethyltransferase